MRRILVTIREDQHKELKSIKQNLNLSMSKVLETSLDKSIVEYNEQIIQNRQRSQQLLSV